MYKLCVCDDKEKCRDFMREQIRDHFESAGEEYSLDEYGSADELLSAMKPGYYDIVFFDVEMDGTNGIEAARRVRRVDKNVVIIFISALRETVFEGFTAEPLTFLTKPIAPDELHDALGRAVRQAETTQKRKFIYTVNKTTNVVPVRDILYMESRGRVIEIITLEDRKQFYGKLDAVQFDPALSDFLRCHQSYLVNPDYIMEISGTEILLTTKQSVPIRRGYAKELRLRFMNYLDSQET